MKCDCCGIESPLKEAFCPVTRVFQQPLHYCPPCSKKRDERIIKASMWCLCGFLALALLFGFAVEPPGPRRNEMLFLPLCFLFFPVCVVLHELAHAATARAVGLRVFAICFGQHGRTVWRKTVFGTQIQINWLLLDGLTLVAPWSLRFYRLRWALTVAAGPLVNGLVAVCAYWFVRGPSNIASAVIWANLFILAIALFPWRHSTPRGVLSSDGLAILSAPFLPRKSIETLHASYFAREGAQCIEKKNYQAAIEWAQKGLREYPGDLSNRSVQGVAELGFDQFATARATFAASLEANGEQLAHRAILLNNVAWADLLLNEASSLEEAERYSQEALQLVPWADLIRGTRGCVLIELGRLEEGISLLTSALDSNEAPQGKANNFCFLAIGMARKGDHKQSLGYLAKARKLDPDCSLISRAQRELSECEIAGRTVPINA